VLVVKRFLPRMVGLERGGDRARRVGPQVAPRPAVPEHPNLFVAGDWVGPVPGCSPSFPRECSQSPQILPFSLSVTRKLSLPR
jgi:hypothetical protein